MSGSSMAVACELDQTPKATREVRLGGSSRFGVPKLQRPNGRNLGIVDCLPVPEDKTALSMAPVISTDEAIHRA